MCLAVPTVLSIKPTHCCAPFYKQLQATKCQAFRRNLRYTARLDGIGEGIGVAADLNRSHRSILSDSVSSQHPLSLLNYVQSYYAWLAPDAMNRLVLEAPLECLSATISHKHIPNCILHNCHVNGAIPWRVSK